MSVNYRHNYIYSRLNIEGFTYGLLKQLVSINI